MTPFGGLSVLVEFLNRIGWVEAVGRCMPILLCSPNAIPPVETLTAFMVAVVTGARRFAHTAILRADEALHSLLGIRRFPSDDTVRNLYRRFGMKEVQALFGGMTGWMLERVPERREGYSLDLDSTVFERYGEQEGAARGYNPRKPGRKSHHPLLAVLAERCLVVHSWLRSGNCGAARGVVEFLGEALELLPGRLGIRTVRADSGFFDDRLLGFLKERGLKYVVVARMTRWLRNGVCRMADWRGLDGRFSVGVFELKLFGWKTPRRFVVVREKVGERKSSMGRKLFEFPDYTYRLFVTNRDDPPEDLWRDYNQRATMENRIAELKHDLAADDFCMRWFYATEAAFRSVILVFNLLSEFQHRFRTLEMKKGAFY